MGYVEQAQKNFP